MTEAKLRKLSQDQIEQRDYYEWVRRSLFPAATLAHSLVVVGISTNFNRSIMVQYESAILNNDAYKSRKNTENFVLTAMEGLEREFLTADKINTPRRALYPKIYHLAESTIYAAIEPNMANSMSRIYALSEALGDEHTPDWIVPYIGALLTLFTIHENPYESARVLAIHQAQLSRFGININPDAAHT